MGPRKHVLDGGADLPMDTGTTEGNMCRLILMYLPRVSVSAQRMQQTNAFAAARGDKKVMRPLAK